MIEGCLESSIDFLAVQGLHECADHLKALLSPELVGLQLAQGIEISEDKRDSIFSTAHAHKAWSNSGHAP